MGGSVTGALLDSFDGIMFALFFVICVAVHWCLLSNDPRKKTNTKKNSSRHITIKLSTVRENVESRKEKQTLCIQGNPYNRISEFLSKNLASEELEKVVY